MKKWVAVAGVVLGVLLVLFAGLTLFVKSYLRSDVLVSLLVPRLEALTGRKVQIEEVNASLFKGISVKGLAIKQRDGSGDFARMEEFILDYRLKPLLRKQLVIERIEIISPYVFVRRERDGSYNFSDMKERSTGKREQKEGGLPLALLIDRIVVKNARVEFADARGELPPLTALIAEVDMSTSLGKSPMDVAVGSGHIIITSVRAKTAGAPVTVSGRVDMKQDQLLMDLTAALGKDTVKIVGTVREYRASPDMRLSLSAKELDIGNLLAIGDGGAGTRGSAAESRPVRERRGSPGKGLRVTGDLKVDVARYQGFTVRNLSAGYSYRNGVAGIDPLSMHFAGGEKVSAEGTGAASLAFRTDSGSAGVAESVKRSLAGKGVVDLSRVQVQRTRITDALALYTGIEELRTPRFEKARVTFVIKDEKVSLEGKLSSDQLRLNPAGTIGFDKRIALLTDLSLSPQLSAKLSPSAKVTGYLKDQEGWSTIPLRITGTLEKPSVGLNPAGVGSRLKKGITGEVERRILRELRPEGKEGEKPSEAEELLKGLFGK
ncbi:MAG: AsmA family protein [Alphaproteobacteria bacterium]|uniref:AsmA family protein n=1 Tax=Candidatus Nitrobium versatile TaxID=2884831 RepID=A0A953J3D5_9BACT|nr:AsmA family protein [Candidatus Nitrobium versatile]